LQVVVFAILFGIALAQIPEKPRASVLGFFEGLMEAMFKFTGWLCASHLSE
jgi:proton glutamate symport protein